MEWTDAPGKDEGETAIENFNETTIDAVRDDNEFSIHRFYFITCIVVLFLGLSLNFDLELKRVVDETEVLLIYRTYILFHVRRKPYPVFRGERAVVLKRNGDNFFENSIKYGNIAAATPPEIAGSRGSDARGRARGIAFEARSDEPPRRKGSKTGSDIGATKSSYLAVLGRSVSLVSEGSLEFTRAGSTINFGRPIRSGTFLGCEQTRSVAPNEN